ncbi:MAG: hypothetical protein SCARUB_02414 [Candidatus Scalindua rubra]|uniref:Uncharacterized protein n=1 Tax=Candidatus Scalindua rubra TaxID=1872076 RepID=A0A1E3XA33_9BACT|nr:MAG: hypothetical protein SCARUB_02414 [Candidatus Scalindua rubra]
MLMRKNIKHVPKRYDTKMTLMDLITLFTEEAYKICKNKQMANLIALKSLQEFIKKNAKGIKIVL